MWGELGGEDLGRLRCHFFSAGHSLIDSGTRPRWLLRRPISFIDNACTTITESVSFVLTLHDAHSVETAHRCPKIYLRLCSPRLQIATVDCIWGIHIASASSVQRGKGLPFHPRPPKTRAHWALSLIQLDHYLHYYNLLS